MDTLVNHALDAMGARNGFIVDKSLDHGASLPPAEVLLTRDGVRTIV